MSVPFARSFNLLHQDLIHDVDYDFYGTRMASCSSDQTVRIWESDKATGDWNCTASWKAHNGAVWKVTWSNPDFGQLIATCSFDRTVTVWEEAVGEQVLGDKGTGSWVNRSTFVDSKASVTDVKFAPKHLGLMIASCSADGFIRIYEAADAIEKTQWILQHEICVKVPCSCLAWNPSYPGHAAPMIAVGSDDDSSPHMTKILIYEYNYESRRWIKIDSVPEVTEPVNDLEFAPNSIGRSFHMLGIACTDVKIVSLEPQRTESDEDIGNTTTKFKTKILAHGVEHNSIVRRIAWNITGTIMASSGDDASVRLWKSYKSGVWKCVSTFRGEAVGIAARGVVNRHST